jgi:hypothetical protein
MPDSNRSLRYRRHWYDLRWVACAVVVATLVVLAYLVTHPYPAYGAGLYLEIAHEILANDYRLPATIPHYTADGVPFAYPPLVFYATAVVLDHTGIDPMALSRFVPPVLVVLHTIPYFYLSRELLEKRTEAGVATVLFAIAPPTLQWHLSAGGLVRSTAFLFTLVGAYVGVRLFQSERSSWVLPATFLFGLTVLTHPVYTVFFGLSYLLFYLAFDRSARGLVEGAVVAVGGGAMAAPWWLRIVRLHGVGVFTSAAGTHTGLFGGPHRLLDQFIYPLVTNPPIPVFFVLSFAGAFYFIGQRRLFLPTWLVAGAVVIGKERFQFVAGSMMAAVLLVTGGRKVARRHLAAVEWRQATNTALAVVLGATIVVSVLFSAGALPEAHHGSSSQPQFLSESDEVAMTWAAQHTTTEAEFVVLGDAAEWFPLLTDRTILVGPWGVEWTSPARYDRQLSLYRTLSNCDTERCVTSALDQSDVEPDYLYVPKGSYTVRGMERTNTPTLRRTLSRASAYRLVYENRGVAIYRVSDDTLG